MLTTRKFDSPGGALIDWDDPNLYNHLLSYHMSEVMWTLEAPSPPGALDAVEHLKRRTEVIRRMIKGRQSHSTILAVKAWLDEPTPCPANFPASYRTPWFGSRHLDWDEAVDLFSGIGGLASGFAEAGFVATLPANADDMLGTIVRCLARRAARAWHAHSLETGRSSLPPDPEGQP